MKWLGIRIHLPVILWDVISACEEQERRLEGIHYYKEWVYSELTRPPKFTEMPNLKRLTWDEKWFDAVFIGSRDILEPNNNKLFENVLQISIFFSPNDLHNVAGKEEVPLNLMRFCAWQQSC